MQDKRFTVFGGTWTPAGWERLRTDESGMSTAEYSIVQV